MTDLIPDALSRRIIDFEVHATDHPVHTAQLLKRAALAEGVHAMTP